MTPRPAPPRTTAAPRPRTSAAAAADLIDAFCDQLWLQDGLATYGFFL